MTLNTKAVSDETEGPVHFVSSAVDGAGDRSMDALKDSETKYRFLAENTLDVIWVLNMDLIFTYVNASCYDLLGYEPDEFIGTALSDHCDAKNYERMLSAVDGMVAALPDVQGLSIEAVMIKKDGCSVDVGIAGKLFFDKDGNLVGLQGTTKDISDLKRTERELIRSESRFRSYVENAPDGIFVLDEHGKYIDINRAACNITGYTKEELLLMNIAEVIYPEDHDAMTTYFGNIFQDGYDRISLRFKKKDGSQGIWSVDATKLPDDHILGFFKEITKEKESEEALIKSEENYRSIFETAANLITSVNEDSIIVDCNQQMKNFLGYEREEIIGNPMSKIIHPDCMTKAYASLNEILETGFAYNKEYKMMRKDGELIDVLINSSGINKTSNGTYERTVCLINDITRRKKDEKRIEYLTTILSSIRNVNKLIVKEKDTQKLAQGICDSLTETHGYNSSWIALFDGRKYVKVARHSGLDDSFDSLRLDDGILPYCGQRILAEKKDMIILNPAEECTGCPLLHGYDRSVAIISKLQYNDNIYGIISASIPIAFSNDQEIIDLFGEVVGDISFALYNLELENIREEAEHSLLISKIAAEDSNKTKSEFLANMSHELRTPLNSIIGFSQILVDEKYGNMNEKQSKFASNVLKSGRHLLELINTVLDISKIESGNMEYEPETVNLSEIIVEVKTLMEPIAKKKLLKLSCDIEPANKDIFVDRIKFSSILYNLFSNAIKFTPEYGEVRVSSTILGDVLEVCVSDTGIGIKQEYYDTIFEPFKQTDSFMTRKYGGTGLGLAIVKKYVEMHGGNIHVESEVGVGSTFTVMIPLNNISS